MAEQEEHFDLENTRTMNEKLGKSHDLSESSEKRKKLTAFARALRLLLAVVIIVPRQCGGMMIRHVGRRPSAPLCSRSRSLSPIHLSAMPDDGDGSPLSDQEQERIRQIMGREYGVGQNCLCAWPTESDAEYVVTVVEYLPDGDYGVLYKLDNSLERVPPNRLRVLPEMPEDESFLPPDDGEIKPSTEEEEALLEEYRAQKLNSNDNWQLSTFSRFQSGVWFGVVQEWAANEKGELGEVGGKGERWRTSVLVEGEAVDSSGKQRSEATIGVERCLKIRREVLQSEGGAAADETDGSGLPGDFAPAAFRPESGMQACGNAYTMTHVSPDGKCVDVELSIRSERCRLRALVGYGAGRRLQRLRLVREAEGLWPDAAADGTKEKAEATLYGEPAGAGLYDGSAIFEQLANDPTSEFGYRVFCAEGGAAVVVPSKLFPGKSGVFCLDWSAGAVRFQLDRHFASGDNPMEVSSLELIEALTESPDSGRPFPPVARS